MNTLSPIVRLLTSWLILVWFLAVVAGCAGKLTRNPLPPELTNNATIPGIPEARFWGDEWPKFSQEIFSTYTEEDFRQNFPGIYNKAHNYLAISGGGANGAFGAGLLAGWTESGTRPEFTMVTGISTGALSAPFAFLGSGFDDILKEVYTSTSTNQIARRRNLATAAFHESVADTSPLRKLIQRYIDNAVVKAIAREHRKGRRLFIGTSNLDAGRSVIWNLGAIAASDSPSKMDLIHDVLQASSAIPVMFPPVVINVDVNGNSYDEMHVDGGTGSQVFVYPAAVDWKTITEKLKVHGTPGVYVIRNSFLDPDYTGVKRSIVPIGSRTINSLIRTQGIGDLYQIYTLCRRDNNAFNLAYILSDFTEEPNEEFDPDYMNKLYDYGFRMAKSGFPWHSYPPGFSEGEAAKNN